VRSCLIYGTQPIKVEHKAKLDRNEMSVIRWMCGNNLKDSKNNTKYGG